MFLQSFPAICFRNSQKFSAVFNFSDFLPQFCEWLLRLWGCVRARGITPEETTELCFHWSPCSAPARPCHHCSHFQPQQGGGAPVPEQGLLCSQDLNSWGWVFGQVGETASMWDQTSSHLKDDEISLICSWHAEDLFPIYEWGPSAPDFCHQSFSGLTDFGITSLVQCDIQSFTHHFSY